MRCGGNYLSTTANGSHRYTSCPLAANGGARRARGRTAKKVAASLDSDSAVRPYAPTDAANSFDAGCRQNFPHVTNEPDSG